MTDEIVCNRLIEAIDPTILEGCNLDQIREELRSALDAGGYPAVAELLGWEVEEVEKVIYSRSGR